MPGLCHAADAPVEQGGQWLNNAITAYTLGMPPEPRPELPGYNSDILCIVMAMLLLLIFNIRSYPRFFSSLISDLRSLRERTNLFETHTLDETRTVVVSVIGVCVCEGLIGLAAVNAVTGIPPDRLAAVAGVTIGAALCYYLFQLCAYNFIGYVFSDKDSTAIWLRGFNASQMLLGATLLLPALALLFYPDAAEWIVAASVMLYLAARIIFIYKGFRIFYEKIGSLLYFILYLCSVEIIPVILLINGTFSLCCNLIS